MTLRWPTHDRRVWFCAAPSDDARATVPLETTGSAGRLTRLYRLCLAGSPPSTLGRPGPLVRRLPMRSEASPRVVVPFRPAAIRTTGCLVAVAIASLCVASTGCSTDHISPFHAPDAGRRDSGSVIEDAAPHEGRDATPPAARDAAPPLADVSTPTPDAAKAPHDAGADADSGTRDAGSGPPTDYPRLLSQTGLFSDIKSGTLADGVRYYEPRYVLWSDGATKRRWLYLPRGAHIDTSDMDFWTYPVGTTAWKEFTRDGVRVETRMLRKNGPTPGDWTMIAYEWKDDLSDAVAIPGGQPNARGTAHDIPSQANCLFCHGNMKDVLLGVSAIQMSHSTAKPGLRIDDLIAEGVLTNPPTSPIQIPGDSVAETALGYLHANCGMCHNSQSGLARGIALRLWESTAHLGSVKDTLGYRTTVDRPNAFLPDLHIIEPGRPDDSELVIRISERGVRQMPPLATKIVDTAGVAAIRAWVDELGRPVDGGVDEAGSADAAMPDAL